MSQRNKGLLGGIILIALGVGFLLLQLYPELFQGWFSWPLIMIVAGGGFLLGAILNKQGDLAVPGCIVGGIGCILYWQSTTGNWESWAYIWTLIPGFVGLGILISGIIDGNSSETATPGLLLLGGSIIAFAIFGGLFGLNLDIARYWPVILIILGIAGIISAFVRKSDDEDSDSNSQN